MKKKEEKWIKSYENIKSPPHWAVSLKPSTILFSFLRIFKKEKLIKERILEVGCGNGRDSIYLAKQGCKVVGIDISPKAVVFAKKNKENLLKNKLLKINLNFKIANVEKLPFPDEYFGGIYSVGVLHSTNLRKSLKEISRVLKKDGVGVIHLWGKTLFLKTKRTEKLCSSQKVKSILKKLPFKILKFSSQVTKKKIDYGSENKNPHKHFAIIMFIKKNK